MAKEKPHMNLAVIGHIDHGKSTLVGRLLYETGTVPEHIIEKYKIEAEEKGICIRVGYGFLERRARAGHHH